MAMIWANNWNVSCAIGALTNYFKQSTANWPAFLAVYDAETGGKLAKSAANHHQTYRLLFGRVYYAQPERGTI
jgi:hypothetical protein